MEEMLYTVTEVAELLKTRRQRVYDLIARGLLPALKLGRIKVRRSTLLDFLAKYEGMDLDNLEQIKKLEVKEEEGELCQ